MINLFYSNRIDVWKTSKVAFRNGFLILIPAIFRKSVDEEDVSAIVMGIIDDYLPVFVVNLKVAEGVTSVAPYDGVIDRADLGGVDIVFSVPKTEGARNDTRDIVFLASTDLVHIAIVCFFCFFRTPLKVFIRIFSARLNAIDVAVFFVGFVFKLRRVGVHNSECAVNVVNLFHNVLLLLLIFPTNIVPWGIGYAIAYPLISYLFLVDVDSHHFVAVGTIIVMAISNIESNADMWVIVHLVGIAVKICA